MSRRNYSLSFKNGVLDYLDSHSGEETARHFKIDARRVRLWKGQKELIRSSVKSRGGKAKRLEGGGRKILSSEAEDFLLEYIQEKRESMLRVSRRMVMVKAREVFAEFQEPGSICKASRGWLQAFLKRNKLSLRRRTGVAQKDPDDLAEKIVSFIVFVSRQRRQNKLTDKDIIAMDETGVNFDMLNSTTIAPVGTKDVTLRCTGHEKNHFTVVLAAKGDGTKLKPTIVFKNGVREVGVLQKKQKDAHVTCSSNGWMNEDLTDEWIEKVLGSSLFSKRLLVWDSYKAHITERIKRLLRQKNTIPAVVPGGCTKYIQAPDVSWNKPFKAHIRENYDAWMAGSEDKEYTAARGNCPGGNLKPPNKELIVKWVVEAWNSLSTTLIQDSFKSCALTTAIDGSEDQLIHCLKIGEPCRAAWELLQKNRDENIDSDLVVIAEDSTTAASSKSFDSDEDSSSDEICDVSSNSSEESDEEEDTGEPFSDEDHPWQDTNQ